MFVLIIILSGLYTNDIIFQEFTSKQQCEVAVTLISQQFKGEVKDVKCIQK